MVMSNFAKKNSFDLLYLTCYKCIPSYNMFLDMVEDI